MAKWFIESAPAGSFTKMSPVSCRLILDGTSGRSLPPSLATHPDLFSIPPTEAGAAPASSEKRLEDTGSLGECWTLNMSEWTALDGLSLNDDGVCSLSDVLETGDVPQRYYLSPRACAGILRRAENRGKSLPDLLRRALKAVASMDRATTLTGTEDRILP
jgi:hypothetical protein